MHEGSFEGSEAPDFMEPVEEEKQNDAASEAMDPDKPKRVLMIGGKGFIGEKIHPHLTAQGLEVAFLDLKDGEDLFNETLLDQKVMAADAVVHMAAIPHFDKKKSWEDFEKLNVGGTVRVLEAAVKHNKRLVYFSSGAVYGFDGGFEPPPHEPIPLDWLGNPDKVNLYAKSKIMAEGLIQEKDRDQEEMGLDKRPPKIILRVNWPGMCPDKGMLDTHYGAEVSWEFLCDIAYRAVTHDLDPGVHVFNAINPTLRDGSPARLEVQNRLAELGA